MAPGLRPLADGQYRCSLCARDLVLDENEVRQVYLDALAALQQIGPQVAPELRLVYLFIALLWPEKF